MKGGIRLSQPIVPILNPVPWQKKGLAARKYVPAAKTEAAMSARLGLAKTAFGAYGAKGKVGGLPVVAAKVKTELSGKDYGGKSLADRRAEAHALAAGSIKAMEAELAKM